jgi:hypothetical protein
MTLIFFSNHAPFLHCANGCEVLQKSAGDREENQVSRSAARAFETPARAGSGFLLAGERKAKLSSRFIQMSFIIRVVRTVIFCAATTVTSFAQIPSLANYTSSAPLAAAVAAIGTRTTSLLVPPGSWKVPLSVTVPSNISLQVSAGGVLVISPGETLTIRGGIQADSYQMFVGSVSFSGNTVLSEVDAKWWGARGDGISTDTNALQAALNAASSASPNRLCFRLPAGTYRVCNLFLGNEGAPGCPGSEECPAPARVYGVGGVSVFNARLKATSSCGSGSNDFVALANSMSSFTLESVAIDGNANSAPGSGASCLDVSWKSSQSSAPALKSVYRDLDLENCRDSVGAYAIDADDDNDSVFSNISIGGPTQSGEQVALSLNMGGGQTGTVSGIKIYNSSYIQSNTQGLHIQDSYLTGGLVIGMNGYSGGTSYNLVTLDNVQLAPNPVTGIEINGLKTSGSGSSIQNLICNACNFQEAGPLKSGQSIFGGYWTAGAVVNGGTFNIGSGSYFGQTFASGSGAKPFFHFNGSMFNVAIPLSGNSYTVELTGAFNASTGTVVSN